MSRRSLLFIITTFMLCSTAFGRDPFTKNELPNGMTKNATLRLADRYSAESVFYTAAENYKLYLTKKPDSRYARYWLAMALYEARDYKGSEEAFAAFYALKPEGKKENAQKWAKEDKEFFKLGHLYYGMALHRNGKYDEAQSALHKFRNEYYTNDQAQQAALIRLAKLETDGCDSSRNANKAKIKVKRLGDDINNPYTQSAPFLVNNDELIYTSLDQKDLVTYDDIKNKKYTSIYKSKRQGKTWSKGTLLPNLVNEPKYFTGNGTYNADRSRFYFTKCLEMDDDRSLCNIFVSEVKNGQMSEPKRLPEGINFESKFTSTQPTVRRINEFKEMVYYATDREGGKGGLDIWYTIRKSNGEFIAPEPLKGNINTAGDEVTPFFSDSTGTLYFSSDGLPGLGGFDVFRAQLTEDDKTFDAPVNMGKPLNTGADELYYTRSKDQTFGFLTSNREGSVPLAGISTASDDIYYWENLHFAVDGDVTRKNEPTANMTGARFNLYAIKPNGKKELVAIDSTGKNGTYFFNLSPDKDYEVEVEKPGFLPTTTTLTTKGLDDEDTLTKKLQVAKDAFIVYGKIFEDDSSRMPPILNAALLIYEIRDGRELLFRELTAQDSMYYTVLPTDKDFKILARKEGFFAGNTRLSTKGLSPNIDSLRADIKLKRVIINKEYKLSNILYEFDKATLTEGSKKVLDTLYDIMRENPSFVIELASHTDGKGSDPYNLRLSQSRAQSCVDYLVKKGIEKKRMNPIGYGMRKPIAPNKNEDGSDDPEGRALNRRTEFKIVKM
jgi:outer membrane protein OmpA-like peptidoglycan-associated protein/tetratricopeptide (TPR) repeat protein